MTSYFPISKSSFEVEYRLSIQFSNCPTYLNWTAGVSQKKQLKSWFIPIGQPSHCLHRECRSLLLVTFHFCEQWPAFQNARRGQFLPHSFPQRHGTIVLWNVFLKNREIDNFEGPIYPSKRELVQAELFASLHQKPDVYKPNNQFKVEERRYLFFTDMPDCRRSSLRATPAARTCLVSAWVKGDYNVSFQTEGRIHFAIRQIAGDKGQIGSGTRC